MSMIVYFLVFWFSLLILGLIAVAVKTWNGRERSRSKSKVRVTTSATVETSTSPAGATAPARPTVTPGAGQPLSAVAIVVTTVVFLAIIGFALSLFDPKDRPAPKPESKWGRAMIVQVSDIPTVISWLPGAVGVRINPTPPLLQDPLAPPRPRREYDVKSGDFESRLNGDANGTFRSYKNKPLVITSVDGDPLDLTIQWKR